VVHNAVLAIVAAIGIAITLMMCVRIVRGVRRKAPNEMIIGYFAVMLIAALASVLVMRVL